MLFIPLPFVVTLLLAILFVRMLRDSDDAHPGNRLLLVLVAAYTLQSVLIGLRWGYDLRAVMPFQAVLAAIIAPLAYVAFSSIAWPWDGQVRRRLWIHAPPVLLVALLFAIARDGAGLCLILIFLFYGLALLAVAAKGTDALVAARLDGALRARHALVVTAAMLLVSALTDIAISLDFMMADGLHAGAMVAGVNVILLLVLAAAASGVRTGAPAPAVEGEQAEPSPTENALASVPNAIGPDATEEDEAVAVRLDDLMRSRELYKDVELSLERIARRLGLPARRVSQAVNRRHGVSVSQYVNNWRIKEACRLLRETREPVTRIMFEAGFLSKSNFNREFLRVAGTNPTAWRQRIAPATAVDP